MAWKHRYSILSITFFAYLLCYLDRMVMASAIPYIAEDFHLSPMNMGVVFSAFFIGYASMQIPGGLLADRFGPRTVLAGSVTWFSIMTAATGMVSGLTSLLIVRALFGLGEGPFPPAALKTVSNWFPLRELGRASGLQQVATGLGATAAPLFTVVLIAHWGWRSVFYCLFIPGIVLTTLVWRYVRNSPAASHRVTPQEMADYEILVIPSSPTKENFLESLRTPAVLWCAASMFLANTVAWGLMNWLPTYLLQARGFGMGQMGIFAAITNLAGALGFGVGGYLCDKYFSRRLRVPIIAGFLGSTCFTYLAAIAPNGEAAVACLVVVFLLMNIAFTAIINLPLVIVPKHRVGGAFGIVNTAGQISGVLSPLLVGYILKMTHGSFEVVLYSMVVLIFVAVYPAMRIRQLSA